MEDIILWLQSLDPLLIYIAVFSIAFIENVFPPSPSDLVVVFAGSLIGIGRVGFVETLLVTTMGSTVGFIVMYKIGDWFGARIIEGRKIKFLPLEGVHKVESWFARYGYGIIIANRFLAGTRAVVSFFAGMSKLNLTKTTLLSFLSALAWNAILLTGGFFLGDNWQEIDFYLSTYSTVVTVIVVVAIIIVVIRVLSSKNNKPKAG